MDTPVLVEKQSSLQQRWRTVDIPAQDQTPADQDQSLQSMAVVVQDQDHHLQGPEVQDPVQDTAHLIATETQVLSLKSMLLVCTDAPERTT